MTPDDKDRAALAPAGEGGEAVRPRIGLAPWVDPFAERGVEQPPAKVIPFFLFFLRPVKGLLAAVLAITLLTVVVELSMFFFLGKIVDWTQTTPPGEFLGRYGWALAGMAFVVLVIRPIGLILSRSFNNLSLVPSLTAMVRWQNYRYVLRQSLSFFQNDFAGRVAQKVMQTGPALRETVGAFVDGVWSLIIYLAGTFYFFIGLDWRLLIPVGLWLAAYCFTIYRLVPPVRDRSAALSEANSALSGRIVDSYTNIQSVKLFAHAAREDAFALDGFRRQLAEFLAFARTMAALMLTLSTINSVLIVAVSGLAVYLWTEELISVGAIALAISLVLRLNQMSNMILRQITSLFENVGTVQNGIQTISRPNLVVDAPAAPELKVTRGEIRFEDVSFHYGRETGVIDHLTLTVRPGERVGLVGRSGAGKSTLVNLLLRFYDLEGGRILIDGQDTSLLHRSVRDNIAYGRPSASQAEIVAAAERAHAAGFIRELRDFYGHEGFDARTGERGVKLSGGQRQRVAIARLLLKDAPILLLDEATSALDSEVEAAIQEQLYSLMSGRTVIAIAHRLSTIAVLDRLVIIDKGRIVETGTHEELIARNGLYAKLWRRQSGGFLDLAEDGPASQAAE